MGKYTAVLEFFLAVTEFNYSETDIFYLPRKFIRHSLWKISVHDFILPLRKLFCRYGNFYAVMEIISPNRKNSPLPAVNFYGDNKNNPGPVWQNHIGHGKKRGRRYVCPQSYWFLFLK